MPTAEETLALVDVSLCLPLVLIMNFSLFQYLATTFWTRRQERRVRLLLFIAALSFASLIPFGYPDPQLTRNLNDVSEVCSILTFLLQITILTRDVGKRIKIRSVWVLLWIGELLVVVSLFILISNAIAIIAPSVDLGIIEELDDVTEIVSLLFIVGFRFYFLSMAKGYRKVWATQKTEIVCYLLFLTHSLPFLLLTHLTGLAWVHVQGVWMRVTIVMCLWRTVKARLSSQSSKQVLTTTPGAPESVIDTGPNASRPSLIKSRVLASRKSSSFAKIRAVSLVAISPLGSSLATTTKSSNDVLKFTP